MKMPTFLIIGAPKAGTTALYHYLKQHPQIYMSPVKEPSFFALEGETLDVLKSGNHSTTNWEDYCKLFQKATEEHLAIGEASTTYLYSPKAPARIKEYLPNIKLIAVLRDPVERAYSNYQMIIRDGYKPLKSFLDEIQNEESSLEIRRQHKRRPITPYLGGGFYYKMLKRYFNIFDKSQIKIILYDDFKKDNIKAINDIFDFVDVELNIIPDVSIKYNVSNNQKKITSNKSRLDFIKKIINTNNLENSPNHFRLKNNNFMKHKSNKKYFVIRKKLIKIFQDDILRLQDLLAIDLSSWII